MGKVPQSRYTMGLSVPANLLSIPSSPLSSNCSIYLHSFRPSIQLEKSRAGNKARYRCIDNTGNYSTVLHQIPTWIILIAC